MRKVLTGRSLAGLAAGLALALASGASMLAQGVTREFHHTYALSAHGTVSLENINGNVQITGWDRNEVKVDAIEEAQDQDTLNRIQIHVESSPGGVYIKTEFPHDFFARHGNWHVNYTVMAPKAATIDKLDLVNGDAEVQDVSGDVHASSVNGHIRARNLSGAVHLSAVNGPIEASLGGAGFSNPVNISTVNGPITVSLFRSARVDVAAHTLNGAISNAFGWAVTGKFVGHRLEGGLGRGGARVELSSVNGSIDIRSESSEVE
ncbi:MAG: hypothetical protein ACRD3D_12475 [Terriglobia bacterium]